MTATTGQDRWLRALQVALLAVAGWSIAAGTARAQGCHVPDRPVFGLTAVESDSPRFLPPVPGPLQVGKLPCSPDLPTSTQFFSVLGLVGELSTSPTLLELPSALRSLPPPPPLHPSHACDGRDRPPRHHPLGLHS